MTTPKDLIGRTHSTFHGWTGAMVPVGAHITILSTRNNIMNDCWAGSPAVVVMSNAATENKREVRVRLKTPRDEWVDMNEFFVDAAYVSVDAVGDGQVIPGRDYRESEGEVARKKFMATDHTYEGYTNRPTYLAALYLRADGKHNPAIRAMVRKDGSINPNRVRKYFYGAKLKIDDWAWYTPGIVERIEFRNAVNWEEIAKEFAEEVAEDLKYAQKSKA